MSPTPVDGESEPKLETFRETALVAENEQARLTLDYELSRVPISAVHARLEAPGSPDEVLGADFDSNSNRRILIERTSGDPFPKGATVHVELLKVGDAPRRVHTFWTPKPPPGGLIEYPELVSALDVFTARRTAIEKDLTDPAKSTDQDRFRFENFLSDWDRETFTTENVVDGWTDLSPSRSHPGADACRARFEAITLFTESLFVRARRRGLGMSIRSYAEYSDKEATQLNLIGDLHEKLFELHFGAMERCNAEELGRSFIKFATCDFWRAVTVKNGTYLNGRPNGAVLVALSEFADLLAERDGRQGFWHELHPSTVGCIAAYARAHGAHEGSQIAEYGLGSLLDGNRLESNQVSYLWKVINDYAKAGSLQYHWIHLLYLLAPRTFDLLEPRFDHGLEHYVDPPETRA